MGSWGYYPTESDGAYDLFYIINQSVHKELENITADKNTSYHYAGLIMMLLQKGFFVKHKFVVKARDYINDELEGVKAGNHKSGWRNPKTAEKTTRYLLQKFDELIEPNKQFYLTTNKLGGKDISKRTVKWRANALNESTILAPYNWIKEENLHLGLCKGIPEEVPEEKEFDETID